MGAPCIICLLLELISKQLVYRLVLLLRLLCEGRASTEVNAPRGAVTRAKRTFGRDFLAACLADCLLGSLPLMRSAHIRGPTTRVCYAAAQLQQEAAKGQAAGEAALARVVGQLVRSSPKKVVCCPSGARCADSAGDGADGAGVQAAAIAQAAKNCPAPKELDCAMARRPGGPLPR